MTEAKDKKEEVESQTKEPKATKKKIATDMLELTTLEDIENPQDIVLCVGTGRSGSTLVWNVAKTLLPSRAVIKAHVPEVLDVDVVLSVRDPRDAIVSSYRMLAFCSEKPQLLTISNVRRDHYPFSLVEKTANKVLEFYKTREARKSKTLLLKYEDFWNSYEVVEKEVGKTFGVEVGMMDSKWDLAKTLAIQESLKEKSKAQVAGGGRADVIDKDSQIHSFHIGEREPGQWKKYVSPALKIYLDQVFVEFIKTFGY